LFKLQIGSQDPSVVEGQTIFSAMLKIKQILKQNEQIFKDQHTKIKDLEESLAFVNEEVEDIKHKFKIIVIYLKITQMI
jgi:hypothetical protein